MESYISFNTDDSEEEEHLYCSAPQAEEDMIWAGSDTEQSAEEIERKRARYEYHAHRCLRGQLPVLLSASLKGPFDKDWVNPWRYRRRKVPDWWQPGSKDMLFTKANVLKRAAEHGMGHLSPADALAWCKAEAEAEAQIKLEEDDVDPVTVGDYAELDYGSEADAVMDDLDVIDHEFAGREGTKSTPYTHAHLVTISEGATADIDIEHRSEWPDDERRNATRPADSLWLLGSYVSKRAKWDQQAASSPTPIPNLHLQRDRRSRLVSEKSSGPRDNDNPTTPWSHEAQDRNLSFSSNSDVEGPPPHLTQRILNQHPPKRSRLSKVASPLNSGRNALHNPQEDALEDYEDELSSQDPMFSIPKSVGASTPTNRQTTSAMHLHPLGSLSTSKLPTLPRTRTPSRPQDIEDVDEISFITEIAPSSRDLEHFRYRKRRRSSRQESSEITEITIKQPPALARNSELTPPLPEPEGKPNVHYSPSHIPPNASHLEEELDEMAEQHLGNSQIVDLYLDSYPRQAVFTNEELPPIRSSPRYRNPIEQIDEGELEREDLENEEEELQGEESEEVGPGEMEPEDLEHEEIEPEDLEPEEIELEEMESEEDDLVRNNSSGSWDMVDDTEEMLLPMHENIAAMEDPTISPLYEIETLKASEPLSNVPIQDQHEVLGVPEGLLPTCPSQTDPKLGTIRRHPQSSQGRNIGDESTQSYNSTPMASMRSPFVRAPASSYLRYIPEAIPEDAAGSNRSSQIVVRSVAGMEMSTFGPSAPNLGVSHTLEDDEMVDALAHNVNFQQNPDYLQVVQQNPSPDHQSTPSEIDDATPDGSLHSSDELSSEDGIEIGGYATEGSSDAEHPPVEEEEVGEEEIQGKSQEPVPQSPWATINIAPILPFKTFTSDAEANVELPEDEGMDPIVPETDDGVQSSGWQHLERASTPEPEGIKPFKDFMTPTPSPERKQPRICEAGLPSTQLLEAALGNPWTSTFKNPASGKVKKRVSFGVLPSEESDNSQPAAYRSPEKLPRSPPMPRTVRATNADIFNDETPTISKFENHFKATGGSKRMLARGGNEYPPSFSSPAVGAMAEAFIAADRDTSLERDRPQGSPEIPSKYLKPTTTAKANMNTSPTMSYSRRQTAEDEAALARTIDYDMDSSLNDLLGDMGGVLEEWSVEAELKKTNSSPESGKKSNKSSDEKRGLFSSFTSGW